MQRLVSGQGASVRASLLACALLMTGAAAPATAGILRVTAGGNLQAALDAAQPGDVILLEAGATFVGNFILPAKTGSDYITIRTAADLALLPAPGRRVQPGDARLLPKLRSAGVEPALRTAPGAHHWRIELIEFEANRDGYNDIIVLGDPYQVDLTQLVNDIVIDRCYIHGHPLYGQKRGISLQSGRTTIANSYISDMKGVGMDTQAIGSWNGPGPYLIENNYLEGAGENVLIGGADPRVPNLVASDIVVRRNLMSKPEAWRLPIVSTPQGVTAVTSTGGSLAAGTYSYRVVARRPAGQGSTAWSLASTEVAAAVGAAGAIRVSWSAVSGAADYVVYRRGGLAPEVNWTMTGTSLLDSGGAAAAGGVPSWLGTKWSVKNIFELKNARRVTVEGNVFEYNWVASQNGYSILFTPRNQDGTAPWTVVESVVFQYNIVRHVSAVFNILGRDYVHPSQLTRDITIRHNLFHDVDGARWAGDGRFMIVGEGPEALTVDHNTVVHTGGAVVFVYGRNSDGTNDQVPGFRFTNNLVRHNDYGILGDSRGVGNDTLNAYFPGAVFARNVLAGGSAYRYPADNLFPPATDFLPQFVAPAQDHYALAATSPYRNAGIDGKHIGADIDTLAALTGQAISGTGAARPPTAASGGPYGAFTYAPLAVNDGGSSDQDGRIVSYVWSWGDGCAPSTGASQQHQYTRAGDYVVTLTVTDDSGLTATSSTPAAIWNRAPIAAPGGPYSGAPGAAIAVNGGSSSDIDGSVVSYTWNWGDGSPNAISAAPGASHAFAAAGQYSITLTVTDDRGASASASAAVSVKAPTPEPRGGSEIVIYAAEVPASAIHGNWTVVRDSSAAGGAKLATPDADYTVADRPLAQPRDYFEATFDARSGVAYRLWLRMAALYDSTVNDAIWVQFTDAVDAYGAPLYRSGTTHGLAVNLATTANGALYGWGWQNGAYWLQQETLVRFEGDGAHTIRVQSRQDGAQIDQIVLSPVQFLNEPPGPVARDTRILAKPLTDVVAYARDVTVTSGAWQHVLDPSAAAGVRLATPDGGWASTVAPLAEPVHYVDVRVPVQANVDYRLWLRMNAQGNNKYNDSLWIQFSEAASGGASVHPIGSTTGLVVNLATSAMATSLAGWGWQTGAYWLTDAQQPSVVRFPFTGLQTVRVQLREDGVSIDQIVLSPARFLNSAPGAATSDRTIIQKP